MESKYTILSKSTTNNIPGKSCNITYIINSRPYDRFNVELYCLGRIEDKKRIGKYAFIEGKTKGFGIDTVEDRSEFLEELKKFQCGSSYKKSHPIKLTKLEELKQKEQQLKDELSKVRYEIDKENANIFNEKALKYDSLLKKYKEELNVFINELKTLFTSVDISINPNPRYCLKYLSLYGDICIWDKIEDKPMKRLICYHLNDIRVVDLYESDISRYY